MTTPRTGLPELAQNQASKHITHNEALRRLDALVQAAVERQDLDSPPAHSDGTLWVVGYMAWDVVAVDTTNDVVEVSGDQTGRLDAGEGFTIADSTGNDGAYSIASLTYNSSSGNTEISTNESIGDSNADGEVRHADGAWNSQVGAIAQSYNGAWYFVAPWVGLRVWDRNQALQYRWNGTDWVVLGGTLDALTDVDAAAPSNGQLLQYNSTGGKWEATDFSGSAFTANEFTAGGSTWNVATLSTQTIVAVTATEPVAGYLAAEQAEEVAGGGWDSDHYLAKSNAAAAVAVHPESGYAVTGEYTDQGVIRVWDWALNLIDEWVAPVDTNPSDMAIDPGTGNLLEFMNGTIYVMDGVSGTVLDSFTPPNGDYTCAVDPNTGNLWTTRNGGNTIRIHDGISATEIDSFTFNKQNLYALSGMAHDGSYIYFVSKDGNIGEMYDAADGSYVDSLDTLTSSPRACDWDHSYGYNTLIACDGSADNVTGLLQTRFLSTTLKQLGSGADLIKLKNTLRIASRKDAWAITAVDTGGDTVKVSGDQTTIFANGDSFDIVGSTGNDGTYTLTSRSWSIVAVDTTNDYFELSGDVTARFEAGETFEVSGSTGNDGTYTVSSVVYDEGGNTNTRVYTNESIGDSTADGSVDLAAVRYYSGSDETQLQTSESIGDSTADGDVEMWKGTAYASANWAA